MDKERWRDFVLVRHHAELVNHQISQRWHEAADETTRLMLNVLFILNGGGLVAIPTLHPWLTDIPLTTNAYSGLIFFAGLVLAGAAGITAIVNFRSIAANVDARLPAQLQEIKERWEASAEFTPSQLLTEMQSAKLIGHRSIPATFYLGWVFAVLSFFAFIYGGLTLGGDQNPACIWLGTWCVTH